MNWRVSYTTMKWWERLDQVITNRGLRVADVAQRAGIPDKTLYGYLKGATDNPRGDIVKRLAEAVNLTEAQLRLGEVPNSVSQPKWIPVLDMKKLRMLKANEAPISRWDQSSRMPVTSGLSDGCFVVELIDNACAPEYRKGDQVICDPTANIEPGDYVIAVLTEDSTAHFAQYRPISHRKSSRFELVHTNKNYPSIEVGGSIKGFVLGRAIKHIRDM